MSTVVISQGAAGPGVVFKKRISIDFATIPTLTNEEGTVAFAEADAGDGVQVNPTAALPAGLALGGCRVSATGVVSIAVLNPTGGTLTPNTLTFDVLVTKAGIEA